MGGSPLRGWVMAPTDRSRQDTRICKVMAGEARAGRHLNHMPRPRAVVAHYQALNTRRVGATRLTSGAPPISTAPTSTSRAASEAERARHATPGHPRRPPPATPRAVLAAARRRPPSLKPRPARPWRERIASRPTALLLGRLLRGLSALRRCRRDSDRPRPGGRQDGDPQRPACPAARREVRVAPLSRQGAGENDGNRTSTATHRGRRIDRVAHDEGLQARLVEHRVEACFVAQV